MPTRDQLRSVFRRALDLPDDVDVESLQYRSIEAWDSVAHMVLVADIEEAFDILLETDDVIDMSSFGTAVDILAKYDVILT